MGQAPFVKISVHLLKFLSPKILAIAQLFTACWPCFQKCYDQLWTAIWLLRNLLLLIIVYQY